MAFELTDAQRATLTLLCDTIVPSIERDQDPHGLWARTASDVGAPSAVEQIILGLPDPTAQAGLALLLDALAGQGLATAPSQASREQLLRNTMLASPAAAAGLNALIGATLFTAYGLPDPTTFKNANWAAFGYPGPVSPPPAPGPRPIVPLTPAGNPAVYEADVCVVGSGAGGGVIAGTLARQGLKVIVLEAAGYYAESDMTQLELDAYQKMYWRGGPQSTVDGNITLQAGTSLGGGTTINWTNCLRTTPWVRAQWAREHGLEGVDGSDYDRHLDTVLQRISANDRCSDLNGPQQRMREAADRLGWSFKTIVRNTDPATYDPVSAGYLGFGDQSGSKQSTAKTFLLDAVEHDAEVIVNCRAERVLTAAGRAAGVQGTFSDPQTGAQVPVRVDAATVVVACGALESPALLLRSGIGGPAVGEHLRLHPALAVFGIYGSDQQAWWGAPQAGLVDEFADTGEGYGFLIEGAQYAPAITGSAVPWTSGEAHKALMERVPNGASLISLTRDRGHGRVAIDADGEAMASYAVTDELDIANMRRGVDVLARLHRAAGAHTIVALAAGMPTWRAGDDIDTYTERLQGIPLRAGGHRLFTAHQMGSCRMGTDPRGSVAGPWGELHDTPGVWIGDGSAFPTSSGTNPMISIMALAHRTAEAIAGRSDDAPASAEPLPTGAGATA